jgi:hypothetical protein
VLSSFKVAARCLTTGSGLKTCDLGFKGNQARSGRVVSQPISRSSRVSVRYVKLVSSLLCLACFQDRGYQYCNHRTESTSLNGLKCILMTCSIALLLNRPLLHKLLRVKCFIQNSYLATRRKQHECFLLPALVQQSLIKTQIYRCFDIYEAEPRFCVHVLRGP